MHSANRYILSSAFFLCSLLIIAMVIKYLPFQDPIKIDLNNMFSSPSLQNLWGTDDLGRDVLSRVVHGFSTTMQVSILAMLSSLVIGIFSGGIAGYFYETWIDRVFNWIVGLIFSLPFLLVMAAVLSITHPGIVNAYIILSCIMWVGPARIARAEVIKTKNLQYVLAARAIGFPERKILLTIIMPSTVKSAFTFSISYLPEVIGLEAGLSFLGLGIQPPYPGLGKMIFDGINYLYSAWWLAFTPAITLFIVVMSINFFVSWSSQKESAFAGGRR